MYKFPLYSKFYLKLLSKDKLVHVAKLLKYFYSVCLCHSTKEKNNSRHERENSNTFQINLPSSVYSISNIILTRAGYTCTAFKCTTPVHLNYTCFTPPNSYQFFGLGRKYHLLFDLVRQFPCLRLKITTWWYNI